MGEMNTGDAPAAPSPRPRKWAWWHRQRPATRKTLRGALVVIITGVIALTTGIFTAATTSSLGPHVARYSTSVDHEVRVDLGPLGAVILDSPLPWPLGVTVVVKEIPAELVSVPTNPITGLADDLAAYAQVFSQPEAAISDAARGLVSDAVGRTVLVWSGLLLVTAAARYASRGLLRKEMAVALRQPGVAPILATLLCVVIALPAVAVARQPQLTGQTISALAGTPVEGLRMTGRMGQLVDTYGGMILDVYEDNERFYDAAARNLHAAYNRSSEATRPAGLVGLRPATTVLIVSDLHCNVGMARVIAAAAQRSRADLLIDAGDVVMSGTSVESYCVNAFASALPEDLPAVVATGNHDSVITADQLHDAGYTVLAGDIVEVAGLRLLGDTDPTLTAVGEGTNPERDESIRDMGERLAELACEARDRGEGVDLLVVHNPIAAQPTLQDGCAPLTISGHWHRREGPEIDGLAVRYVNSSTAGAVSAAPTIGPLHGTAEMTVMRIDPATGEPLAYRVIEVTPAAEVHLGPWELFPVLAPEPDPVIGPGGDMLPAPEQQDQLGLGEGAY